MSRSVNQKIINKPITEIQKLLWEGRPKAEAIKLTSQKLAIFREVQRVLEVGVSAEKVDQIVEEMQRLLGMKSSTGRPSAKNRKKRKRERIRAQTPFWGFPCNSSLPVVSSSKAYNRLGIFQFEEVFPYIGNCKKEYIIKKRDAENTYLVNMDSARYKVFDKSVRCILILAVSLFLPREPMNPCAMQCR